MLKTIVIILAILWLLSIGIGGFFWGNTKEKIAMAEENLENYEKTYESINHRADSLEAVAKSLQEKGKRYQDTIDSLDAVVDSLETEREKGVIRVANLFEPHDLVDELRATFPEYKETPIGIARVPHPRTGFQIRSFQLPIQLVATFIADHNDAEIYREQKKILGEEILTYEKYVALQDTIIALKEQKSAEYKRGLDYGLEMYQKLTKEYIDTLKKPPKIGLPSTAAILTTGALGVAAGVVVGKQ